MLDSYSKSLTMKNKNSYILLFLSPYIKSMNKQKINCFYKKTYKKYLLSTVWFIQPLHKKYNYGWITLCRMSWSITIISDFINQTLVCLNRMLTPQEFLLAKYSHHMILLLNFFNILYFQILFISIDSLIISSIVMVFNYCLRIFRQ